MYQQALDSSAQTTTLNAQMPRPFVRGYDRQAVSRSQGGGVYIKGHSRMNGSGFSVGLMGSNEPSSDMGGVDAMPFLARMARQRGYSQAQIDDYKQSRGRGFFGMKSVAEAQASAKRREEKAQEAYAKQTPQQRLEGMRRYNKEQNKSVGQKFSDSLSKPFTKKKKNSLMSLF